MSDTIWKAASLVTSLIVVPLFIWIWTTNTKVEQIHGDHQHTVKGLETVKAKVERLSEDDHKAELEVAGMKKDIEIIKAQVADIKTQVNEIHGIVLKR
jgi:peptidoglycan hydrolase CwlO-like protein